MNTRRLILAGIVATATVFAVAQEDESAANSEARYWLLSGGGEIVGRPVKESTQEIFVDIGPSIVRISRDAIVKESSVSEAKESAETAVGGASAEDPGGLLSQTEMVERAKQSVVLISNPRGAGSGFVLDREGRVMTNHHVIRNEKYHTVNLFRKRDTQWERVKLEDAEVEAYSPLYDIAVLRLPMDQVREKEIELVPMPVADVGALQVGDPVFAIGNPGMGGRLLEHSVSQGIASSLARNFGDVIYIQTTAAVNPGNSGGPLVDRRGRVVGLVTLKAIFQEGIAFALPAGLIHHFLNTSESFAYSEQAGNKGFRYLPPEE